MFARSQNLLLALHVTVAKREATFGGQSCKSIVAVL